MTLTAFFENGSPGSQIESYDPGNADPFDNVISSATTAIYSSTHARGNLAARFSTGASGDQVANCAWTTSLGNPTEMYSRLYVYATGYPASNVPIIAYESSGGGVGLRGRVRLDTDGTIRLTAPTTTVVASSPSVLPLNQWIRLEWHTVHNTSTGSTTLRAYTTDPEAAIADFDWEITATGKNTDANATGWRFGWCSSQTSLPALYIDTVGANAATWLGPATDPSRDLLPFDAWTNPVYGNATTDTITDFAYLLVEAADRIQFIKDAQIALPVARYEIHQNDVDHDGLTDRTEVDAHQALYAPSQSFWLGYSLKLDPTFPSVTSPYWQLVLQMFGTTAGVTSGSPPFALEIDSNQWRMTVRGGTKASSGAAAPVQSFQNFAAATKGVWHQFLFSFSLSTNTDGVVSGYHRLLGGGAWPSTPSVTFTGINVLTVAGVPLYTFPESTLYRMTRSEVGVAYFSGLWIRADRSDVEPFLPDNAVSPVPNFQYQTIPKLLSGPQKPTGLGPDPSMTGAP